MAVSALVRNAVNIVGSGSKTLVLGHGLGTDQRSFARMIEHFRHDYRVVSFDLTGAGQSLQHLYNPTKYESLGGHAQDLVQICDDLGLEGALYVGHSGGGMIGALASISAPRIFYNMVMIGASPHYINEQGYVGGTDRKDIDAMIEAIAADYVAWCDHVVPMSLAEPATTQLA